ncbi:hypothetical protein C2845_PM07G04730 [Panicum miliaceum]|uniref:Uncharacterized protein n=1 Tax=Panicum miliaceum TaxID=4540 RepID=A0A3L6SHP9_PANMI|nr:hypothetical protein C2845_PM07G04730 [Panicum miliaceum]
MNAYSQRGRAQLADVGVVACALATAVLSATFSFLSIAASLAWLRGAPILGNLRFVEVQTGGSNDGGETLAWRWMELFVEAVEAGGLREALQAASAAAPCGARVSCVVADAFMSMATDAEVPWVAVWTGGPCALLAHLRGDALRDSSGTWRGSCPAPPPPSRSPRRRASFR